MDGHAVRMEDTTSAYRILVEKPKEIYHLDDLGVNGKIM